MTQNTPDWSTRPWGRPVIHPASGPNPDLVATIDFRYGGIKIRGVRLFRNRRGELVVNMPQKKFGESIMSCVYFVDTTERDLFAGDVRWLYNQVFGRILGHAATCISGQSQEWSGSPNCNPGGDPDNEWICDECGRVIPAEEPDAVSTKSS